MFMKVQICVWIYQLCEESNEKNITDGLQLPYSQDSLHMAQLYQL